MRETGMVRKVLAIDFRMSSHRTLRRRMREIRAGRVAGMLRPLSSGLGFGITTPRVVAAATNWWQAGGATNVIGAWRAKSAASYATSKLDLSGAGNNLTDGVAPSWSSAGWSFNGTSHYLKTPISGNSTVSIICQFSGTTVSGTKAMVGSSDNVVGGTGLFPYYNVFSAELFNLGGSVTTNSASAAGNMAVTVAGRSFFNGTFIGSFTPNWSGVTPYNINIGASNGAGSPAAYYDGLIEAVWIGNGTYSDATITAIAAAMAAL